VETSKIVLMHGVGNTSSTFELSSIPPDLKEPPQWVLFTIEGEKNRKVPYQPNGKRAKVNDPKTWSSFEDVVNAFAGGGYDGIGFVLTKGDPFCGIDLDDCCDPANGLIEPWAQEIIDDLPSYAEVSFSGTGVHMIARAKIPAAVRRKGIEIYPHDRFFTMTGWRLDGASSTIEDCHEEVVKLWEKLTAAPGGSGAQPVEEPQYDLPWDADPESVREKVDAMIAANPWFRRTWKHERPDLSDQSLSVYDLALLSQAVLIHGWRDPTDLYLLLCLHREEHGDPDKKSKRRDYVCRTLGKALAGFGEDDDPRVVIKLKTGDLTGAIKAAAAALGAATMTNPFHGIYRYGDQLAEVVRRSDEAELAASGAKGVRGFLTIEKANLDAIEHALEEVARFMHCDGRSRKWVPADVPPKLVRRLLARATKWGEDPHPHRDRRGSDPPPRRHGPRPARL
jgi:hypothetical protein